MSSKRRRRRWTWTRTEASKGVCLKSNKAACFPCPWRNWYDAMRCAAPGRHRQAAAVCRHARTLAAAAAAAAGSHQIPPGQGTNVKAGRRSTTTERKNRKGFELDWSLWNNYCRSKSHGFVCFIQFLLFSCLGFLFSVTIFLSFLSAAAASFLQSRVCVCVWKLAGQEEPGAPGQG